jgi:hypothetical protein
MTQEPVLSMAALSNHYSPSFPLHSALKTSHISNYSNAHGISVSSSFSPPEANNTLTLENQKERFTPPKGTFAVNFADNNPDLRTPNNINNNSKRTAVNRRMSENSLTSNASLKEWDDDMSMAVELSSVDSMAVNDMRECGIQDSMYREETMINTTGNVYSGINSGAGNSFLGIAHGLPGGRYPIHSHPGNRSKANSAENVFGPPQSSPLLNAHNLQQSRFPVAPSHFPSQFPPYVNQQIAVDNHRIEEDDEDDDEDDHLENGDDEESVANSLLVEVINFVLLFLVFCLV